MRKRIYYMFKENEQGYYWRGNDGSKLYFCGNPKFIVDSLINKFGIERGKEVFDNFMEGIRHISDMKYIKNGDIDAGTFVLYRYDQDDNQESELRSAKKIQGHKKEHSKDGENTR